MASRVDVRAPNPSNAFEKQCVAGCPKNAHVILEVGTTNHVFQLRLCAEHAHELWMKMAEHGG